jgi:soluble lytic murein transglycosylase-like protein
MSYNEPPYDDYYEYYPVDTPLTQSVVVSEYRAIDTIHRRMLFILGTVVFLIIPLLAFIRPGKLSDLARSAANVQAAAVIQGAAAVEAVQAAAPAVQGGISPVFSREVQHWAPQIIAWSAQHGLDPDKAATIMQIESCGDPHAISRAGAQGLFQVMPFHFTDGEHMLDPDTNARRGLNYFVERLQQTNGDVGQAFAGYNGGHRAAATTYSNWAHETQRYFVWSTGIYGEAKAGFTSSPTLQKWMEAGGASLCRQAANRLGLQ